MISDLSNCTIVIVTRSADVLVGSILDVIQGAGAECSIEADDCKLVSGTNPGGDNPPRASIDLCLVDVRNRDYPASLVVEECPVIALVDSNQASESLATFPFVDDLLSAADISATLLPFRIRRQIDRYRNPLASVHSGSPEFDLVRILVNTVNDQVYVKDLDHRFLFASDRFATNNGLSIEQVIGKDDLEIGSDPIDVLGSPELGWLGFWAQDDAAVSAGYRTREENPEWRAAVEDTRQNRVYRVPLKNNSGEVYALAVVSSDITQSDVNVVDLKARGAILARAFGAMQKAQESQKIAERAVMEKNKLLAAASHDLRQPLHAMGLFLDVLERRLDGEQEQDLIAKIKRSSDALSGLFNSLLDISRLDAGVVNVNREHFSIETVLDALRSEFQEIGSQKMLTVDIKYCGATLHSDPILFERILRNLIQNAITYTDQGSVLVECETRDNKLVLSVVDTGPGIPEVEQAQIFSEYYQIENRHEMRTKGLGLGLAIVRRLADLLELDISLHSELGRGSVFSVTTPLGIRTRSVPVGSTTDALVLEGQTIVIIDDECDILEGMASMLINYDCEFVTAETSEEALSKLVSMDIVPDVIVADYRLQQGRTGDQAIAAIREEFSLDIPAIIVTGDTSADRLKDAMQSGCQLMHKPVKPDEMVAAISKIVARALQEQASGDSAGELTKTADQRLDASAIVRLH